MILERDIRIGDYISRSKKGNLKSLFHLIQPKWAHGKKASNVLATTYNTDGIFNRFVTVFANRFRSCSQELTFGRKPGAT